MTTTSMQTKINIDEYRSKVYGCWLGKNIGGTLGAPVEGVRELLELTYYPSLPDGPLENDDLDLQLVWLHALEQYGARITSKQLGQAWMEHVFFPFDEYGFALANLRKGLEAPVAGWFNNPFNDCMGSPIRSEIWATVAPGAPGLAAYYAYQDAIVDHAGGEGVYGEMFFAAIESAAFIESDRDTLIQIGLSYIPQDCRTTRALLDLLKWYEEGKTWLENRSLILEHHGRENFTDAPQNIAFTILGWLYGENFEDAILKAVNCGYDTDCTAATLASILGIIGGADSLPEKWVKPVGDRVVVSPPIRGFRQPANLDELTDRCMKMGREVLASWNLPITITDEAASGNIHRDEVDNFALLPYQNRYQLPKGSNAGFGLEMIIDYGESGPAIGLGEGKTLHFTLKNHTTESREGLISLEVPNGWTSTAPHHFDLHPGQSQVWTMSLVSGNVQAPQYALRLHVQRLNNRAPWNNETIEFTLVSSNYWTISGPNGVSKEVSFPGNRLLLTESLGTEAAGIYKAETIFVNELEQKMRLLAASAGPVKMKLNGNTILDERGSEELMPAFHRCPPTRYVELTLSQGEHKLEIEFEKENNSGDLEVYVLPVATEETDKPGPYYYLINTMFAPLGG